MQKVQTLKEKGSRNFLTTESGDSEGEGLKEIFEILK